MDPDRAAAFAEDLLDEEKLKDMTAADGTLPGGAHTHTRVVHGLSFVLTHAIDRWFRTDSSNLEAERATLGLVAKAAAPCCVARRVQSACLSRARTNTAPRTTVTQSAVRVAPAQRGKGENNLLLLPLLLLLLLVFLS